MHMHLSLLITHCPLDFVVLIYSSGCPLASYLYVLAADSFGYLLEVARIYGQVWGILLLDVLEMVNYHFVDDSLLSMQIDQSSIDGACACLDLFCSASGVVVSEHRMDFWLVGLDTLPHWILVAWTLVRGDCKVFGHTIWSGVSLVSIWDWSFMASEYASCLVS
jgi:hypothetical protein